MCLSFSFSISSHPSFYPVSLIPFFLFHHIFAIKVRYQIYFNYINPNSLDTQFVYTSYQTICNITNQTVFHTYVLLYIISDTLQDGKPHCTSHFHMSICIFKHNVTS